MNIEFLFPSPLYVFILNFDQEKVIDKCYKMKNEGQGKFLSNVGGWQSNDFYFNQIDDFKELFLEIEKSLHELGNSVHNDFQVFATNSWININGPYDYNRRHVHPHSTFSACVYVQVDENNSGPIVFKSPSNRQHYFINPFGNRIFDEEAYVYPLNKMLLVFPSWVEHEVLPSPNSSTERISIAFNIQQKI